jgi:hypothetical protein
MITLRHTTLGRTPLDEGSARRRDLSLPDNTQHSQETSINAHRHDSNSQFQRTRCRRPRGHRYRHISRCRGIITERVSISLVLTAGETCFNLHNEVCLFPLHYTVMVYKVSNICRQCVLFSIRDVYETGTLCVLVWQSQFYDRQISTSHVFCVHRIGGFRMWPGWRTVLLVSHCNIELMCAGFEVGAFSFS